VGKSKGSTRDAEMNAFSRPFGTDAIVKSPDPTLKGWAILVSSLRDEGGKSLWYLGGTRAEESRNLNPRTVSRPS
jgi:hypothetical protein